MDGLINVVTNEVISVITLQLFKLSDVDWRKLHESLRSNLMLLLLLLLLLLLFLHHLLLLRRLLAHLLIWSHLLLTWLHVHLHVILVVTSSHGAIVVVLPALVVVTLVVALISSSVLLEISSSSVATSASMLVSSTTVALVSIVLEVSLSLATLITTLHTWTTLISSSAVLLFDLIDKLRHVIDVFVSDSILSFVLCLPKVHFKWFHLVSKKTSDLIKELDCFLSLLHILI